MLPQDNKFDVMLQEFSKLQNFQNSLETYFEGENANSKIQVLSEELDKSVDNSPNAVEIINLVIFSPDAVSLEILDKALQKIVFLQDNLEKIKESQLSEFKQIKQVL